MLHAFVEMSIVQDITSRHADIEIDVVALAMRVMRELPRPVGFFPGLWYPSVLAVLIAIFTWHSKVKRRWLSTS